VNYVYFLWALFYEAVFVVFIPIVLTELIFSSRRDDPWLRPWSAWMVGIILVLACFPAWYSWTQIARPHVFHVPVYNPPLAHIVAASLSIGALIFAALGPWRRALTGISVPLTPPNPWWLGLSAAIAAAVWYGLCVLAFGIRPTFPAGVAVAVGLGTALLAIYLLPRYAAHPAWRDTHRSALALGAVISTMAVNFVGFIYGTSKLDLYGKIVLDVIGTILLVWLALRVSAKNASGASTIRIA
jgi:fluoride ion exporter CrcB/FEX